MGGGMDAKSCCGEERGHADHCRLAPKPQPISVDPERAVAELKWLGLAIATDTTRAGISKLHVDSKRAVATDGHRMHFIDGSCLPAGFSIRGSELTVILDLAKNYMLQTIELREGFTYWLLRSPEGTCQLKFNISNLAFPEYERVMPRPSEPVEMRAADLRKVYVAEGKADYCVIGEGHFNARYVAEALRGAPKRVSVQLGEDDASPCVIRYDGRAALIMPLRK